MGVANSIDEVGPEPEDLVVSLLPGRLETDLGMDRCPSLRRPAASVQHQCCTIDSVSRAPYLLMAIAAAVPNLEVS